MEQTKEKRYYISLHGEQVGPFSLNELARQPVRRRTLVWNEEEWRWVPAAQMAALAGLFRSEPLLARLRKTAPWRLLAPVVNAVSRAAEQEPGTQLAR